MRKGRWSAPFNPNIYIVTYISDKNSTARIPILKFATQPKVNPSVRIGKNAKFKQITYIHYNSI